MIPLINAGNGSGVLAAMLLQIPMRISTGIQIAGQQPLDLASIALATGTVAIVLLLIMIVSSYLSARQRRAINDPLGLLRQLCEAHGFHRRQQRLLLKAARTLSLQQPARLFLEPRLLNQAAEHPSLASRRADLVQIAAELFGSAL